MKTFIIPENAYTVKALVKLAGCPVKIGVLRSIIDYTGLTPVYKAELANGTIRSYYDKDECFNTCTDFLMQHPDTKSFFIKYKNSIRTEEARELAKQKAKETVLKRYGWDNPSKSKEIQEKKHNNFIENYGESFSDYMTKVSEGNLEKRTNTNIQRYGEDFATKFATKARDARLKENPLSYKESYLKGSKTLLEKSGASNPGQLEATKEKVREYHKHRLTTAEEAIKEAEGISFQEIYTTLGLYTTAIYDQVSHKGIKVFYKHKKPYILKEDYLLIEPELKRIASLEGVSKSSAKEQEVASFLESTYSGTILKNSRAIIPPLELDIYLPDEKLAVEFNGLWWHSNLQKDKNYHFNKAKKCAELGIRLIHIYENEWDSPVQQEKVKALLKVALKGGFNKIYARNCVIKNLTNTEVRSFINLNHLQGHRNAKVTYGLFYEDKLIQIMSFSKTNYNYYSRKYNAWEIIRSCTLLNTIVVGGLSKLYKRFIQENNPEAVFSYCDFNKFNGKGYEKLGMQFIGYSAPDFKWIVRNGKYGLTLVNRNPSKNNEMKNLALGKVFGAGSKKYFISYK